MLINSSEFVKSSSSVVQCPEPTKPEYAFLGRSNVGKSSLINMLTGRKSLAKTSSTPGKTQLINHFLINDKWYLVDLPGYGYAKSSKSARLKWEKMIRAYLLKRQNLMCSFILVDSRIPAQQSDMDLMSWFGMSSLPFVIIFTKTDKLSKTELRNQIERISDVLVQNWEELPPSIISSAKKSTGRDEVLGLIDDTNKLWQPI